MSIYPNKDDDWIIDKAVNWSIPLFDQWPLVVNVWPPNSTLAVNVSSNIFLALVTTFFDLVFGDASNSTDPIAVTSVVMPIVNNQLSNQPSTEDHSNLILLRDLVRFSVQRILVPSVTVIGLFGNSMTTLVMCHRRMRTSSTHIYLAALALSDALYLAFVLLLSFVHYPSIQTDLNQMKLAYWYSYPALIFGCDFASNTSIWLTVCFTIERYIVVRYPIKGKVFCTRSRAVKVIVGIGFVCFLITFPTFFEWKTVPTMPIVDMVASTNSETSDHSIPAKVQVVYTELGLNATYRTVYYWVTVLGFVFIPLSILAIFNWFLIRSVQKSGRKRRQWIQATSSTTSATSISYSIRSTESKFLSSINNQTCSFKNCSKRCEVVSQTEPVSSIISVGRQQDKQKQTRYRVLLRQDAHITRLLIVVVLFFLVCQLPSALVIIYTACNSDQLTSDSIAKDNANQNFKESSTKLILQTLGNVFNLLVAVNSAGNFVLYCLLSRKYRQTLREIFSFITNVFKH